MNTYVNEGTREEYLNNYFTEIGVKALEERLQGLAELYLEEQTYPLVAKMLGFVALRIQSREHHEGMMENLKQILGLKEIVIRGKNNDN